MEDVCHDVFVNFAKTSGRFKLKGSLRGYLSICVANRARDVNRAAQRRGAVGLAEAGSPPSREDDPELDTLRREQAATIEAVMADLPDEQRTVLVLHLQGALPFREIAALSDSSINTVTSRYRYGLEKLRAGLDGRNPHA
jgi:RNA polymerase sigma-70 factor (ECF subfamily)